MATLEARQYVFPLFGGDPTPNAGTVANPALYGTAFYLGNSIFMTAGHSVENAFSNEHSAIMVGWYGYQEVTFFEVSDHEIITDFDIALVKVEDLGKAIGATALPWDFSELPFLEEVLTAGFPHGLDLEEEVLRIRALQGYIVAATKYKRIFPTDLYCYELSFSCDRGLSGAPLLSQKKTLVLSGVIVRNIGIHIPVYYVTEKIAEEGREETYERTETTSLGLAIMAQSLRFMESRILGETLGEYVERNNLVR